MSNLILTEAAKSERKYKCPFCDYRNTKSKLVDHIDKKHKELIPKDYTAARIVFNMINKKDHGTCVCGCGRETAWREDVWRYDRYATSQCKEKYSAEMKQRMIRVYGKEHLLNDPEMQEKMLNNRSISGTYKFTHGGEVSYVGSYEMKLLEFLDKVMGYKAIDVQSPGPTIEYMYNGKKHFWMTDQYLIPYNLVFDCKDGGDNPNNREMKEYREKQIAKEEAIRKQGKYNYIRLTNNNFAQLMLVLAELKERMLDIVEDEDPIIRIFESAAINEGSSYSKYPTDKLEDLYKKKYREYSYVKNYSFSNSDSATDRADEIGTMKEELDKIKKELDKRKNNKKKSIEELCSAVMGALVDTNELYGVSYIRNNSFTPEYGITDDINMDYVLTTDDIGNIFGKGKDFFNNECESYRIFKYNKPVLKNKINFEASNLLEVVTGKKILHPEQLLYDTDFEQVLSENILTSIIESSYEATLKKTDYKIPIINKDYILDEFVMFYKDSNGYFVENTLNNLRSKSYPSLESIDKFTIDYISKGKLFG